MEEGAVMIPSFLRPHTPKQLEFIGDLPFLLVTVNYGSSSLCLIGFIAACVSNGMPFSLIKFNRV